MIVATKGMLTHRPNHVGSSRPWSSHPIVFDESGSQAVRTILQACALDPSTTTIQKLHSVDPLIECTTCHLSSASHYGGRLFMRWPHAVCIYYCAFTIWLADRVQLVHSSDHNFSVNSFGELTEKIFACEPPIGYGNRICCVHCHEELPHRAPDLRAHLLEWVEGSPVYLSILITLSGPSIGIVKSTLKRSRVPSLKRSKSIGIGIPAVRCDSCASPFDAEKHWFEKTFNHVSQRDKRCMIQ